MTGEQPAGGAEGPATLSSDGSTVAWVGVLKAPAQTTFLPGEAPNETTPGPTCGGAGMRAKPRTRRIHRKSAEPECEPVEPASNKTPKSKAHATGRFTPIPSRSTNGGINGPSPRSQKLDGYTVAVLGRDVRVNLDRVKAEGLDIFLTSMKPGVTRKAGTSELTRAVNGAQGDGSASITSSTALIRWHAHKCSFTQRDSYVLPTPDPVGSFSADLVKQSAQLYTVDLTTDTLERAVVGVEGEDLNPVCARQPDAHSGRFYDRVPVSQASNLIFGDANGCPMPLSRLFRPRAGQRRPRGSQLHTDGFAHGPARPNWASASSGQRTGVSFC